jgi:hypothetical protein
MQCSGTVAICVTSPLHPHQLGGQFGNAENKQPYQHPVFLHGNANTQAKFTILKNDLTCTVMINSNFLSMCRKVNLLH